MSYLLDTHAFLWLDTAPERLSARATEICRNLENRLMLSVASLWEIQIKSNLGKLRLPMPLERIVREQQKTNGIRLLPIKPRHIYALTALPDHHRDPFDRLLIAQAMVERCSLITGDALLALYPVTVLW